ncbi:MAG: alpha/beta hydrolase [Myxococcales bacterium]|nr:alpha/beta hydrolase [Myxococcales bacterium]
MKRVFGIAGLTFVLLVAGWVASAWEPDRPVDALKARWAPPPSTFLALNGMDVHLRDEGPRDDPKPIVLLHGTSASLHTWDGWTAALSKHRRVIRFDLPGFGLTGPSPTADYTVAAYARFVVAVLDALSVKQCVLAGNSLGGEIAWATAVAAPERVGALILVDAAGHRLESVSVPIGFRAARTPVLNKLFLKLLPRRIVTSSVRNVYGDPSKVTDELVDRYFELTLREGNRASLPQRFQQAVSGANEADVTKVTAPTLILWGELDRLIPPSHAALFAKEIPGSTLVTFPELGHVPHEEEAPATVAAVERFLAAQGAPAPP